MFDKRGPKQCPGVLGAWLLPVLGGAGQRIRSHLGAEPSHCAAHSWDEKIKLKSSTDSCALLVIY